METLGVSEIGSSLHTGLHKQLGVQAIHLHLYLAPCGANSLIKVTSCTFDNVSPKPPESPS